MGKVVQVCGKKQATHTEQVQWEQAHRITLPAGIPPARWVSLGYRWTKTAERPWAVKPSLAGRYGEGATEKTKALSDLIYNFH